jgi:hypothetical protein
MCLGFFKNYFNCEILLFGEEIANFFPRFDKLFVGATQKYGQYLD